MPSTRLSCHLAIFLFASIFSKADLASDAAYIAEECLSHHHFEAVKGSLLVFAKQNNLSDDEMAARLLYIANPANGFTNSYGRPMSPAAIGGLCFFENANSAVPALETYIQISNTCSVALRALGYITKHDGRFFEIALKANKNNSTGNKRLMNHFMDLLRCDEAGDCELSEMSKFRMQKMLLGEVGNTYENASALDELLSLVLPDYSNSVQHVRSQQRICFFLIQNKDDILKNSVYRILRDNRKLTDEEWYFRATNACQSEIARVMALPEGERLNMTAILDDKIAAIEDGEARAARRATWKRRLRLIGGILLPVSLLTLVAIVLRRRGSGAREMRSSIPEN
ncbi:MAG: hypothetical protein IJS15_15885 [Victivallales bacterium]|nr:hypothetical protein [Victivallales bacterium]